MGGGPPQATHSPQDLSRLGLSFFKSQEIQKPDQPRWATPGVRPEDWVSGMKESDQTALNTREFRYYSYFQRIRERLDHAWLPILKEKLRVYYYSGKKLETEIDHVTKVMVVLNAEGEITQVLVLEESGTRELDSAAVMAFNKAGPFPNPPVGMMDAKKEVRIPWDFILKT
ncbi:unnamed protein product [Sphagnum tenellum]